MQTGPLGFVTGAIVLLCLFHVELSVQARQEWSHVVAFQERDCAVLPLKWLSPNDVLNINVSQASRTGCESASFRAQWLEPPAGGMLNDLSADHCTWYWSEEDLTFNGTNIQGEATSALRLQSSCKTSALVRFEVTSSANLAAVDSEQTALVVRKLLQQQQISSRWCCCANATACCCSQNRKDCEPLCGCAGRCRMMFAEIIGAVVATCIAISVILVYIIRRRARRFRMPHEEVYDSHGVLVNFGPRSEQLTEAILLQLENYATAGVSESGSGHEGDELECPICLESIEDHNKWRRFACHHGMCIDCLWHLAENTMKAEQAHCPICRKPILSLADKLVNLANVDINAMFAAADQGGQNLQDAGHVQSTQQAEVRMLMDSARSSMDVGGMCATAQNGIVTAHSTPLDPNTCDSGTVEQQLGWGQHGAFPPSNRAEGGIPQGIGTGSRAGRVCDPGPSRVPGSWDDTDGNAVADADLQRMVDESFEIELSKEVDLSQREVAPRSVQITDGSGMLRQDRDDRDRTVGGGYLDSSSTLVAATPPDTTRDDADAPAGTVIGVDMAHDSNHGTDSTTPARGAVGPLVMSKTETQGTVPEAAANQGDSSTREQQAVVLDSTSGGAAQSEANGAGGSGNSNGFLGWLWGGK